MNRLSGGIDYAGFGNADIVVEAVFEDIALKQQMVKDIEELGNPNTIFASNTSSLPITEIAANAQRPERVIGMHFFSPVEKMPLVEVIVTDKTAPEVTAATVALARRMGKHVIVVQDCPGFYTTRALAPYMTESLHLLLEGNRVEDVDAAVMGAGFPVGPFTLMDEVGIDVGVKVIKIMDEAYGERMDFPDGEITARFMEGGRLGRKTKKGFYLYEGTSSKGGGAKDVDSSIYSLIPEGTPSAPSTADMMVERLLLGLVNEVIWCLHDGILREAKAADLGAVMGIGFPPFLGGPLHYCDQQGLPEVLERLKALEAKHGRRFKPCPLLEEYVQAGRSFHS